MRRVREQEVFALCPHSAVGVHAATSLRREAVGLWAASNPMVCVLTAHASKFSETYEAATGEAPPLCEWSNVEELRARPQHFEWLRNVDDDRVVSVAHDGWA